MRRTLPLLVVLVAALAMTESSWLGRIGPTTAAGTARDGAPNVVLITMDTVRAQSLSVYGYERETTPRLAELAARGVKFERVFTTAPWTLPTHASLFTGRFPHELSVSWLEPLDSEWPTLADALHGEGYETAAFVANLNYCGYESGLDRGFRTTTTTRRRSVSWCCRRRSVAPSPTAPGSVTSWAIATTSIARPPKT